MGSLGTIIWTMCLIPVGIIGLTLASSGETVRELVDRFFMFFLAMPEMLRNGCAHVIGKTKSFIKRSADSVGLTGEHVVQRIIGAFVLTIITVLSIAVSTLTLIVTLMGVYGTSDNKFIESLPVSVEVLMAIELIAGVVLFGILLLDVAGTTHVTKFFTGDNLNKVKKLIYGGIFTLGLITSIGLLGLGGVIRADALTSGPAISDANTDIVMTEGMDTGVGEIAPIPEGYKSSAKILMTAIPVVSATAGAAGFCGAIPFLAMLIKVILFIPIVLGLGIFWIMGYAGHILINLLYNFFYTFANIFITLGETIRGHLTQQKTAATEETTNQDDTAPSNPVPDTETSNGKTSTETEGAAADTTSTMYSTEDKNWNPIA